MEIFKDTKEISSRKNRPHGEITSKGKYEELLLDAKKIAKEISKEDGVVGITLSGGLSRGYGDDLSEIDLNIYLEDEVYNRWIIGLGPIPHGDTLYKGKYLDIKFFSFDKEKEEIWNLVKKWDASYNILLFDLENKVEVLLKNKDIFSSREKFLCASQYFVNCRYIGNLVVLQWIKRGDYLAANQLISKAISSIIAMVFLANDEYPPHDKWALNYSYSLKWLPTNWKKRISNLILVKDNSIQEVQRRNEILVALYKESWEKIIGVELKDLNFIELVIFEELQYIMNNSPVPVDNFTKNYNIKHLSCEPMFQFTSIITENGTDYVVFDKENYIKQKEADFDEFLDWNKSLLRKLKLR